MSDLLLVAAADDGAITSLRLHTDDAPRLEPLCTTPVGPGVGTFAVDRQRGLVHAGVKADESTGDPAAVVTLRVDRATGRLTEVARTQVGDSMTYLALDDTGTVLLGASYGGGYALTWPLADGIPQDAASLVEHANAHCVLPVGDHAYVVALGEDRVAQYHLGDDGSLTPLDPPAARLAEGCGPRHLIVEGSNAYLTTEYSAEVIRLEVGGDGALTPAEAVRFDDPSAGLRHSRMGADPAVEHLRWGADLHLARTSGTRWLIASERTASTLTSVPLDPSGRLGRPRAVTTTVQQPRGFVVTPDERHVVAVGEKATEAELFRLDEEGRFESLQRVEVGAGANWARFA